MVVVLLMAVRTPSASAIAADPEFSTSQIEFFETKVRPLLVEQCFECHSKQSKNLQGGLRLDGRELALAGGDSGPAIAPGKPDESLLIESVRWDSFEMPPQGKLSDEQIATLVRWVEMDAPGHRATIGRNRLLWRMNPRRLDVEAWRDSLLAVTGELDRAAGGPPTDRIDSRRRTLYFTVSRNGDRFASDAFLRLRQAGEGLRPGHCRPDQGSQAAGPVRRDLGRVGRRVRPGPTSEGKKGHDHDHYGYTVWLAGGGVKGGISYGATDPFGLTAVEDRVHVHDLHATILHLMGLDHEKLTYRYSGRDYRLTDVFGRVVHEIIA
jgi:hypothetical protein